MQEKRCHRYMLSRKGMSGKRSQGRDRLSGAIMPGAWVSGTKMSGRGMPVKRISK